MRKHRRKTFKSIVAFIVAFTMIMSFPSAVFANGTDNSAGGQTDQAAAENQSAVQNDDAQQTQGTEDEQSVDKAQTTQGSENDAAASEGQNTDQSKSEKAETKYPAASLSGQASGISVDISAPKGALPEGVSVKVTSVSDSKAAAIVKEAAGSNEKVKDAKAVDITFYDKDGSKIEPKSNVSVTFSGAGVDGDDHAIYHETSSGNVEKVADINSGNGGTISSDDFSIYVIGGTENNARATYNFYDGTKLVDTQIVKDGEELTEPSVPDGSSDQEFKGWAEKGSADYQTFGAITVTEDVTVDLYANYAKKYYVNFYNQNDVVAQVKSGVSGDKIKVSDVTVPVASNQALAGWTTEEGSDKMVGDTVTLKDSNITLYPVIKDVYWITYHANGGSYTAPSYVIPSGTATATAPADPTKTGYTFNGWYTDKDLQHEYDFDSKVTGSLDLYAKWSGKKVDYTVIYWKETLKDGKYVQGNYSYGDKDTMTASAGSKVDGAAGSGFKYYHFSKGDTNVEVKGDGSTIVNVYYDLNTYKFQFDLDDYNHGRFNKRTSTLSINNNTYNTNEYIFTARMGEDIADRWPGYSNIKASNGDKFYGWTHDAGDATYVSKRFNITTNMLDSTENNTTTVYKANYGSGHEVTLNYWLENANDTGYTNSTKYQQKAITDYDFNAKQIDGFEYDHDSNSWSTYNFYYKRNTYKLSFYNYNQTDKTKTVKYEASISGENYTPTKPDGLSDYYEFAGWYTTSDCYDGSKFSFKDAKMPQSNLTLYAKWAPKTYTVTFDSKGGTPTPSASTVDAGKTVKEPTAPEKSGYTFAGWMNGSDPFNFNTEIYKDTKLTAKWLSTSKLSVNYNAAPGTFAGKDTNSYIDGSYAKVLGSAAAPAGQYFQGWVLDGTTYYPGDTVQISSENATNNVVTLTAKYGSKALDTSLTYHANYTGSTNVYTVGPYINNYALTIASYDAFTRTGYHIVSWNTEADGQGKTFEAGSKAGIDNIGSNDLYAQWAANEDVSYTVKYLEKGSNKVLKEAKTVTGKTFNKTYTENAEKINGYTPEKATQNITLNEYDKEMIFYYTANEDVSYKVNYLEKGTDKVLKDAKTATGMTFNKTYTENAEDIDGYNVVGDKTQDITLDAYNKEITFYYTARDDISYTVKYLEKDSDKELAKAKTVDNQTFGKTVNEKAIDIEGYNKVDPTTKDLTLKVKDNTIIFYYTARTDISYTVKYVEKDNETNKLAETKTVTGKTFNETYEETAATVKGYTPDANKKSIKLDDYNNVLTFYYTANTDVSYTVKYLEKDSNKELAKAKTVTGKTFNKTYEETAATVKGYTPDANKKSIKLDDYNNVLTFYYTANKDVGYTVKYVEKGNETNKLAETKTVTGKTFNETYEETAATVKGYTPDANKKSITLDEYNKVLTFYYTANKDVGYTVKYVEKDNETNELAKTKTVTGKTFNETYKEAAATVKGYTPDKDEKSITLDEYNKVLTFYYTANTDVSYTVKYLEKDSNKELAKAKTVTGKTFNETYEETAATVKGYTPDANKKSIKLDEYNKVLTFYYTANKDVGYTVKYVEKDNETNELAKTKTVTGKTFNETYKEAAATVKGYTPDKDEKSITLDEYNKVLTFYYTANTDVSYTVKYVEKDNATNELAKAKTVTGKTFNETYEETAATVKGYTPDANKKSIKLDDYNNVLTFYYTANTDVSYTVKYVEKDNETNKLAETKTVTGKTFNETYEETAATVKGYTPDANKKSIKLDEYNKVLTFYYTANTDVSYTVKYVEKDNATNELAKAKTVTGKTFNETYKEAAATVKGYTPDKTEKSITLDEYNKVLTFYYTANKDVGYTVKYVEKGNETNKLAKTKTVTGKTFNETYEETAATVKGYTPDANKKSIKLDEYNKVLTFYYTANKDVGYTVKYVEKDNETNKLAETKTVTGKTFNETYEETAATVKGYTPDANKKSIKLDEYNKVLTFYYTANTDVSYTVKYVEKDNETNELAKTKTVTGKTFNETYKEAAIDIEGYDKVDPTSQEITLDDYNKEITFYYVAIDYTITYINDDGKEFAKYDKKHIGDAIDVPEDKPTKAKDENNNYAFDSWDLVEGTTGKDNKTMGSTDLVYKATYVTIPLSVYTLTINYVDEDGKVINKKYSEGFKDGSTYSVDSPELKGYTLKDSSQKTLSGTITENVEFTVVYDKDPAAAPKDNNNNDNNGTTNVTPTSTTKSTKTGDESDMNLWVLLAMMGLAGAIVPVATRKKEKHTQDEK